MAGNALGRKLGVTSVQIKKIKRLETQYTNRAQQALQAGNITAFKNLIAERDAQTAWLRTYAY